MRRALVVMLAGMSLAGCATTFKDPNEVKADTTARFDPYSGAQVINGPMIDTGDFPNITKIWLTGGASAKTGGSYIQLLVWHWSQTGWKFLSSASDVTATPLALHPVDRSVNIGGTVEEKVAIDMPESFLDARATTGVNVRILGQKGSLIVELPPAYVQGYLEKYRAEKAKTSAAADTQSNSTPVSEVVAGNLAQPPVSPQFTPSSAVKLGVQLMDMSQLGPTMKAYGIQGVSITFVQPDLPAAKAGLVPGDMIIEYDGKPVGTPGDVIARVGSTKPGSRVSLKVRRLTGAIVNIDVQL